MLCGLINTDRQIMIINKVGYRHNLLLAIIPCSTCLVICVRVSISHKLCLMNNYIVKLRFLVAEEEAIAIYYKLFPISNRLKDGSGKVIEIISNKPIYAQKQS